MSDGLECYAAIGDMRTLALVHEGGSIDWLCWPRFDAPSIFGRLLDDDGGHWVIHPTGDATARKQVYISATNVLVTRLHTETGVVEIEDLMAIDPTRSDEHVRHLIRRVRCVRGEVDMVSEIVIRPDYGRGVVDVRRRGDDIDIDVGLDQPLVATASVAIDGSDDGLRSSWSMVEGDVAWFSLGDASTTGDTVDVAIDDTIAYWQQWSDRSSYQGRWREAVARSALALKLLTSAETGGLLAAGTTSLPEVIGGERNWDYRYVWIRDAAFTLYALLELGYTEEAAAFTGWLTDRIEECSVDRDGPPLTPLYDLDGNAELPETTLGHWSGYADSTPVRVGNDASGQMQLDIYGELIDSLYLADKQGGGVSLTTWRQICLLIDWVVDHWETPDDGMWEARSGPQRYTSSLLMCWVAVERAMRMAHHRGRPADLERWRRARDDMHATLVERGYSDDLGAFTQTLDGDTLDASLLLMPMMKIVAPDEPMWLSTLDAIDRELAHGSLVDRYDLTAVDDGLAGDEGSFTICSFWFVEALCRAGRVDEARRHFDRLLTYASPTGLFSEQIGPNGRLLGNYPQAFTHLALISAAVCLDEALGRR